MNNIDLIKDIATNCFEHYSMEDILKYSNTIAEYIGNVKDEIINSKDGILNDRIKDYISVIIFNANNINIVSLLPKQLIDFSVCDLNVLDNLLNDLCRTMEIFSKEIYKNIIEKSGYTGNQI